MNQETIVNIIFWCFVMISMIALGISFFLIVTNLIFKHKKYIDKFYMSASPSVQKSIHVKKILDAYDAQQYIENYKIISSFSYVVFSKDGIYENLLRVTSNDKSLYFALSNDNKNLLNSSSSLLIPDEISPEFHNFNARPKEQSADIYNIYRYQ